MAKTSNYGFPLPNPRGLQIAETAAIATAITGIDVKLKEFSTSLANHKHKFADLTGLPTTLEGYGIEDAMTAEQTANAIKEAVSALLGGAAPEALDTLAELAKALGDDPDFAANVSKALGLRVSVDTAQDFTLAQKTRGRANLNALGTSDKGAAGGVASLDAAGKVPPGQLPALTTTATVGAAMAGANGKETLEDGDFFGGVLAGGSTMFKITWGNLKAAFTSIVNAIVSGNMPGRAYPRRSDGGVLNFIWGDNGAHPAYLWGAPSDNGGTELRPYPPGRLSVNYANSAGNANAVGGWSLATIQGELNWRVNDTRFAGYLVSDIYTTGTRTSPFTGGSGYVTTAIRKNPVESMTVESRQPQIHIPNVGWRALGAW